MILLKSKMLRNKKSWINLTDHKYPKIAIRDDQTASFDYLMSMDLYKLTEEEIEELKKKKELKQAEFDKLYNTTSADLVG